MDQPIVRLEHLTKRYGDVVAVSDLCLETRPGEVFALLGPNGAGKTTTLRMMMGLLAPTAGRATIAGLDCFADRPEVMRRVGYVPDSPALYDYLTGREIIRFCGELHGLGDAAIRARADGLAGRLSLADDLDEFAVNYSRGMKKKLAVVCALLHEPEVLILDEPSAGLDPLVTRTLHGLVRARADAGCMVLFSTHLLDQAERLCDRVGILHRGRLAALGSLADLQDRLAVGGALEEVFFAVAGAGSDTEPAAPTGDDPASPGAASREGPGRAADASEDDA
jgi:ABC-2 type transport system ATP-binding protein